MSGEQKLQTSLIGRRVRFTSLVDQNIHFMDIDPGDEAEIVSAYVTPDGGVRYSVLLDKSGEIRETIGGPAFKVLGGGLMGGGQ